MGADLSRIRMNPLLDFAGVELKQGGVLLDADANELVAIIDRRLRALASDTLGRATVSSVTPDAFKISASGGTLQIGRGRLYVDGLLAECHGASSDDSAKRVFDDLLAEPHGTDAVDYLNQPYFKSPPPLPDKGQHLIYLDVWDREVTHHEQPDLIETAVAVETSSRLQTVWQVRVLAEDGGTALECGSKDDEIPGWEEIIAPSGGRLTSGTYQVAAKDDPCELPPTGGFRGLENQLYRVEIHDPGGPGASTFKWSRENGSVASRVATMVSKTELQLETLGRDDVLRFKNKDWVEIIDDVREFSQRPGEIRQISIVEATRRISFATPLPADLLPPSFPNSEFSRDRRLRVRRWDQARKVYRSSAGGNPVEVQDLDSAASTGVIQVPADPATQLLLEDGVTVSFSLAPESAGGFKTGDYWVFAARTSDASVELLDRAPPRGVHHHFARLGIWDAATEDVSDCRHPWPPVTGDCDCGCTRCVTPESQASGKLTIQDAVDQVRDGGGTICLKAGVYALRAPIRIAGASSIRIRGQGAATRIVGPGAAFVIERSAGVAIEDLAIFSLGRRSAISVRTVFGLTLRQLVVATFENPDAQGAAIALSGIVAGANIQDNLLISPDGVRALEPEDKEVPAWLVTAAMAIDSNVLACRDAAIKFDGLVGHFFETRVTGNQVIGTREVGLSFDGLALPGASLCINGNNLQVHGPGIRCSLDGLWIADNKLHATRDNDRLFAGAGIRLINGLDRNGSNQAQLLGNQIEGFPDAGIAIEAPVLDLMARQNIIEGCGNGILMTGSASAASVSIENNHVHDIGSDANESMILGVGLIRAEVATVSNNVISRVGLDVQGDKTLIAGISALSVKRTLISENQIGEIGPEEFGNVVAGISIRAPYERAEILHNHVERDAEFKVEFSRTNWRALYIDEPGPDRNRFASHLGIFSLMRVDESRTLVTAGNRAWLHVTAPAFEAVTGAEIKPPGASASVLGNVFIARGSAPAVEIFAAGETIFSNNVVELRNQIRSAVQIETPVAVVSANRVRGGEDSINIPNGHAKITVIGNITTGPIHAPIPAAMAPLNLIG